jgi:general secretion pathway protein G
MILHKRIERDRSQEALERLARAAFTLMEMLIVVAIIVALAGVGGIYLIGALKGAKEKTAKLQAQEISNACTMYNTDHGHLPQSLDQLLQKDDLGGPYMTESSKLLDPWQNRYQLNPSAMSDTGAVVPEVYTQTPEGVRISSMATRR